MPDWKTFIIEASWVSGIEKVREYWMKACTSPMLMEPLATRRPPNTATSTYCRLPMKKVAGWMRLDMNWAPKEAWKSSSLVWRNRSSTSCWRPKDFTMAWPVKVSSIWELRTPVCCHWAMKRGRARRAMARIDQIETGTVVIATSASAGSMREHHRGDADQQEHRGEHLGEGLLEALGDVVEVVGDAAEQVAAGLAVDVGEREVVELGLGLGPEAEHEALHDAGEDEGDGDAEEGGDAVDGADLEEGAVQLRRSRCRPAWRRPSMTRSVASPRILGPATLSAVLTTASTTMRKRRGRSGRSRPQRRRTELPKLLERSVGMPKPPGPIWRAALLRRGWRAARRWRPRVRRRRRRRGRVGHAALPSPSWDSTISA